MRDTVWCGPMPRVIKSPRSASSPYAHKPPRMSLSIIPAEHDSLTERKAGVESVHSPSPPGPRRIDGPGGLLLPSLDGPPHIAPHRTSPSTELTTPRSPAPFLRGPRTRNAKPEEDRQAWSPRSRAEVEPQSQRIRQKRQEGY